MELLTDYHSNGSYKSLRENVTLMDEKNYAWMIRSTDFENNFENNFKYIDKAAYEHLSKSKVFSGDLIINKIGNAGKVYLVPEIDIPCSLAMNQFLVRINNQIGLNDYIYFYLLGESGQKQIMSKVRGATTKTIDKKSVRDINIPLPPLSTQKEIVAQIEAEQEMVNANKKLIKIYEQKVKDKIGEVWGE
jgi:type I restriction enzyme, S subunit